MRNQLFASHAEKPKYGRIQDAILERIRCGDWAPGDRIPPERDLARFFGASVGTVRHALSGLVAQGFLNRAQGRGTFVNRSAEHTDSLRYYRLAADFDDVVQPLSIHCLGPSRLGRFPEAARELGLEDDTPLFEVDRIFRLGAAPVVFVRSYLPQRLFEDFGQVTPQMMADIPLYLLIEQRYNMPTLSTKERFSAEKAGATVAAQLKLAPGDPVLKIHMIAVTTRDLVYEYRYSYCNTSSRQIYRD